MRGTLFCGMEQKPEKGGLNAAWLSENDYKWGKLTWWTLVVGLVGGGKIKFLRGFFLKKSPFWINPLRGKFIRLPRGSLY